MKALILYHYFHPDDVISARLFSDVAAHLTGQGWDVTALPCTRSCRNPDLIYPNEEKWKGIQIRRVARPAFRQSSSSGRIANGLWMITSWARHVLRAKPDLVIVGTDPPASPAFLLPIRRFIPQTKVILWSHDVYPELIAAERPASGNGLIFSLLKKMMADSYRCCDAIVDIGPGMKNVLSKYQFSGRRTTITPWSLTEPETVSQPDAGIRRKLFGEAKLALLYSGNYGRAHDASLLIELARRLKANGASAVFSVRGNCVQHLEAMLNCDDTNITVIPAIDESGLKSRLESADIHLLSLNDGFSGLAVPSKFFGSLSVGRPVVYAGPKDSDIAMMISGRDVGWQLDSSSLDSTANSLRSLIGRTGEMAAYRKRAHDMYNMDFSKELMLDKWTILINSLTCRDDN